MSMEKNAGCLICGEKLVYSENAVGMRCMFCGEAFYTNAVCGNDHYVCDECHAARALEMIMSGCLKSKRNDALAITYDLMMNKWVPMHGPEHHFLVAAALLTAYNARYGKDTPGFDLQMELEEALKRTQRVPGGFCGFWGCCGIAIGAGIFASVVLKANPLSGAERGTANLITAKALEQIAAFGGPRCCKRESFSTIFAVSEFTAENWRMPLTEYQGIECRFFDRNYECTVGKCPFHPRDTEEERKAPPPKSV